MRVKNRRGEGRRKRERRREGEGKGERERKKEGERKDGQVLWSFRKNNNKLLFTFFIIA